MDLNQLLHPELRQQYQEHLASQGYSPATITRKDASLNKFTNWAKDGGYLDPPSDPANTENLAATLPGFSPETGTTLVSQPQRRSLFSRPNRKQAIIGGSITIGVIALVIFLLFLNRPGAFHIGGSARETATITAPVTTPLTAGPTELSPWIIHFQGKITSATSSNQAPNGDLAAETQESLVKPLNEPSSFVFKLYSVETGGTPLWTSKSWQLTPDATGTVKVPLGDITRGDTQVAAENFFQHENLFLSVSVNNGPELASRFPVSTAANAANSLLLDRFPAKEGADALSIPVINDKGALTLAAPSPKITSDSGTFAIEGQAITLQTPFASDGSITLSPDGAGTVNVRASNQDTATFSIINANLTTGALLAGTVASDAQGFKFIEFLGGASLPADATQSALQAGPSAKFSVDATGNIFFNGGLRDSRLTLPIPFSDSTHLKLPGNATSILGGIQLAYDTALSAGGTPAPSPTTTPSSSPTASTWTDAGTYLYPTGYEAMRLYDSGGTKYIEIKHDGSNAIIDTTEGEIQIKDRVSIQGNLAVNDIGSLSTLTFTGTTPKIDLYKDSADSTLTITNSNATYRSNASLEGQMQLGQYVSTPTAIGAGSLVYNTSDTSVYVWNGTSWIALGGGGTAGFWQQVSGVVSPLTITDSLAIGATDATAPFFVDSSGNTTITGTLTASGLTDLNAGLDVNSGSSQISLNSNQGAANAVELIADSGGIDISTGSSTGDIDILSGDAINLKGTLGAISLSSGTQTAGSGLQIDTSGYVRANRLQAHDSAGLSLYEDGGNGIFVEDGGQVGLGTSSPNASLEIYGSSSSIIEAIRLNNITTDKGNRIAFYQNNTEVGRIDNYSDASYWYMNLGTYRNLTGLVIRQDGRIGIGDTSPDDKLDVESSTLGYNFLFGSTGITFSTSGTSGINLDTFGQLSLTGNQGAASAVELVSTAGGIDISTGSSTSDIDILSGDAINLKSVLGDISLSAGSGFSYASGLTVDATNGYVGLGDESPAANLVVGIDTGATTASGPGDLYVQRALEVDGDTLFGSDSTDLITFTSRVSSDFEPQPGSVYSVGTASNRWEYGYFDNLNVTSLEADATNIAGTTANSFTINTDASGTNTEDSSFVFECGDTCTNAAFYWDASAQDILSNKSLAILDDATSLASLPDDINGTLMLGRNSAAYESITWNDATDRFEFSDDIYTAGSLTATDQILSGAFDFDGTTFSANASAGQANAIELIAPQGGIDISTGSSTGDIDILSGDAVNITAVGGAISFSAGTTTTASGLTIENGGQVGIGTASPSQALDIAGGSIKLNYQYNNFVGDSAYSGMRFDGTGNYNVGLNSNTGLGLIFDSDNNASGTFFIGKGSYDPDSATQYLTILNSGYIGIGDTSPDDKLDIEDSALGYDFTFGSSGVVFSTATSDPITMASSGDISLSAGSFTTRSGLTVDSVTGYVGVWTSSPEYVLTVITDKNSDGIVLKDSASDRKIAELIRDSSASDPGTLNLYHAGSMTVKLTGESTANSYINNSGNLGIGDASPDDRLDIENSTLGYNFLFGSNGVTFSTSNTSGINVDTFGQLSLTGNQGAANAVELVSTAGGIDISAGSSTGDIDILSGDAINLKSTLGDISLSAGSLSYASGLTVDATNGYVGIGTASPTTALYIANIASTLVSIENSASGIEIQGSSENAFNLYTQGDFYFKVDSDNDSSNGIRFLSGANSEIVTILESSGNFGIGDTSPDDKLDIEDANLGYNFLFGSGGITFSGSGTSDFTLTSARDILFNDDNLTTAVPLSLADTALNASLAQGIIDAINDTYDAASGIGGGLWTRAAPYTYLTNTSDSVGIGDTSPDDKLDIEDSALGYNFTFGTGGVVFSTATSDVITMASSGDISLSAGSGFSWSSGLVVDATSGFVGIGTASAPSYRLTLESGGIAMPNNSYIYTKDSAGAYENIVGISSANNVALASPTSGGSIQYSVRNASGVHQFIVTGSEKARINGSGNMGIGDTSPDDRLDIEDAALGYDFTFGSSGVVFSTATSDVITMASSGDISLSAGSFTTASGLVVDSATGYIGIGTAAPIGNLQVNNNSNNTSIAGRAGEIVLQNTDTTTNAYTLIQASSPTGTIASGIQFVNVTPASNYGRIDLQTRGASGYSIGLSVLDGKIGIGDTAPDDKLDIENSTLGYNFTFGSNGVIFSTATSDPITMASSGDISLSAGSGFSYGSGLTVDATNGYVGIGTASPGSKLHVGNFTQTAADISTTSVISGASSYPLTLVNTSTIANGNTNRLSFSFGTSGWTATNFIGAEIENTATATTALTFGTYSGGLGERMRLSSGGNLGIGDTSPDDKLDIENSTLGYNFLFGSGGITFSTSGTSGINIDTFGQLSLTTNQGAASALELVSTAGGIDISAGSSTGDIDILSGDAINLKSTLGDISLSAGTFTTASGLLVDATNGYVGILDPSPDSPLDVVGPIRSSPVTLGGTFIQGIVDADASYARSVFSHNAWWNPNTNLWNVEAIGANDAQAILIPNGAGFQFIIHPSTENVARTFTHTEFTAGAVMTIGVTGNVGIGDTSPDDKLDIEDSALGYNFTFGSSGVVFSTATSDVITMAASGDISLSAGTQTYASGLTVDATNGYVGIGTASPTTTLDVAGSIRGGVTTNIVLGNVSVANEVPSGTILDTTGTGANLSLLANADTGATGIKTGIYYYKGSGGGWMSGLEIANTSSGYGNLLLMKSGGNVGIGDTSPDDKLDIEDSALGYNFTFGTGGVVFSTATSDVITMASSGDISLSAGSFTTVSGLTVDATNGYVGMGTASPTVRLEVYGGDIKINNTNNSYSQLYFSPARNGTETWLVRNQGATNDLHFTPYTTNGDTPAVVFQETGNVGIGDSTPDDKLDIENSTLGYGFTFGSSGVVFSTATSDVITMASSGDISLSAGSGFSYGSGLTVDATNGYVGLGDSTPSYPLDISGMKVGVGGIQAIYVPEQTNFTGTLIFGNTGANLAHSGGDQGKYNTSIGIGAGEGTTGSWANTAVGYEALHASTDSQYNTAVGFKALYSDTSGHHNIAVGSDALYANTIGTGNTAVGEGAIYLNTEGNYNVSVGRASLYFNQTGDNNTVVGDGAGQGVVDNSFSNNILFGYQAGDNLTTGSTNIIIGYNIDAPSPTSGNVLALGNLIFGTGIDGTGTTVSSGNIGIGTTAPDAKLEINHATGDVLRLTYNDSNGSAAYYTDFSLSSSGDLTLDSSGNDIIIASTDNLGIGDTSPDDKLDIENSTLGYDFTFGSSGVVFSTATSDPITMASSGAISLSAGSSTKASGLTISTDGNVGIGTSTPGTYSLYVAGTGRFDCASTWADQGAYIDCSDVAEVYPIASGENLIPGDIIATSPDEPGKVIKSRISSDPTIIGVYSTSPGLLVGQGVTLGANMLDTQTEVPVAMVGRVPVNIASTSTPISSGDYLTASSQAGKATKAITSGRVIGLALENWTPESGKDKVLVFINPHYSETNSYLSVSPENGSLLTGGQEIQIVSSRDQANSSVDSIYQLQTKSGTVTSKLGAFSQAVIANLESGLIKTKTLFVAEKLISPLVEADTITTRQLLASTVGTTHLEADTIQVSDQLISPIIETDQLSAQRSTINNLRSENATISGSLTAPSATFGELVAHKSSIVNLESEAVETASISARLAHLEQIKAQQIESKTIKADQYEGLTADQVQGLDQKLADLLKSTVGTNSSQRDSSEVTLDGSSSGGEPIATQTLTYDSATPEGQSSNYLITQLPDIPESTASALLADMSMYDASDSSQLAITNNAFLEAEAGFFSEYLAVMGQATINQLNVNNTAIIGNQLALGNNSISTLGCTDQSNMSDSSYQSDSNSCSSALYLQPAGSGSINLLAGLMTLDPTGNVTVNGDLTVTGTLATNSISTQGKDLTIDLTNSPVASDSSYLSDKSYMPNSAGFGSLLVRGVNNEIVASIDASGSAQFRQLTADKLIIASGEASPSSGLLGTTITTNATTGEGTLPSSTTEFKVVNPNITPDSLVYITPTSPTGNQVLYVKSKKACAEGKTSEVSPLTSEVEEFGTCVPSFIVGLDKPIPINISFNWWIIN